eukprot:CFRG4262T1
MSEMKSKAALADIIEEQEVVPRRISNLWQHPIIGEYVPVGNSAKGWMRWILAWLVPGLGMFMESYMIFSTGQIKSIWEEAYPECWTPTQSPRCVNEVQCTGLFPDTQNVTADSNYCNVDGTYPTDVLCSMGILNSVSYTEFAGVMIGMLTLSLVSDRMGRRVGSLLTTAIMTIAGLAMTVALPVNGLQSLFLWFAIAYFGFGYGVGGEYPVSASSAAERSQANATSVSRGMDVGLTFSCQGIGAFIGSLVIVILLLIMSEDSPDCAAEGVNLNGHNQSSLIIVWRVTYGIGVFIAGALFVYRYTRLKESTVWQEAKDRRTLKYLEGSYAIDMNNPVSQYQIAFKYYWSRLIATAGCWCMWDIAFYGNKLFSGPIFAELVPDGSLIQVNSYILLNNFVALIGYYCAASVIDRPWMGRRRLQLVGLSMMFGPNMTTYVTPTEVYPVALRATCHGLSSFCGMAGALGATIAFGYLDTNMIFMVCALVSAISVVFTYFLLPNVTEMHLIENDRYLEMILTDKEAEYKGEVRNPKFCSHFERWNGFCDSYHPHWLNDYRNKLMHNDEAEYVNSTSSATSLVDDS